MIYLGFTIFLVLFIFISGLLAGSETAITGASRAQVYQLSKKGDIRAQKLKETQDHLGSSISTILVATNFVNYIIPSITAWFSAHYMDSAILPIIVAIVMSVYCEIFPKMLAINFTCEFAMFVVSFVQWLVKILKPVVTVLEKIARVSLRGIGVNVSSTRHMVHSDEELRGAIELHSNDGNEGDVEKKFMLNGILDLGERDVESVITHRKNVVTLNADLSPQEMIDKVLHSQFSRIPVWKDSPENIIGVLRVRALLSEAQRVGTNDIANIDIKSLIAAPWFIPNTTELLEQLQEFRKRREHFAIVVDEYGDLMGIVTLEDILEEIVGEIVDEYDSTQTGISVQSDGSVVVDGTMAIRDLNRQLEWGLTENYATTLAGLVMHEVRKIPEMGEIYILYGYRFEILRRQRNQISLMKITKLQKV